MAIRLKSIFGALSSTNVEAEKVCDDDYREMSISQLARQITRTSTAGDGDVNSILNPETGSELDPSSSSFDATAWVKSFMHLLESRSAEAPLRKSGIAFRNLSVSGYGNRASYQRSTGNLPLSILSATATLISSNRHKDRIEILRDFDGVVNDGEMLLVLGPPGSGCSTLLKTLAGQVSGLDLSPDSYLNYRGKKTFFTNYFYHVFTWGLRNTPQTHAPPFSRRCPIQC